MAKSAVMTRSVDFEPIDRLEEKVKLLVGMIDRLRADNARAAEDNARAAEDNARLTRELDTMRARIAEADGLGPELSALKEERDLIRSRVSEMLQHIESLNL